MSREELDKLSQVDFNELVDLKNEKDEISRYDVEAVARFHCKKVKQCR